MTDRVQIRITRPGKHFLPEGYVRGPKGGADGQTLWVLRENATNGKGTGYIDTGLAEPVGAGPTETKPAGPTEAKPSLPDEQAGRSTDSVRSAPSGADASSSASAADQASPRTNANTSVKKRATKKSA